MPVKGTSRQTDRDCLVCGETTRIAHLGIDVCRACAVFYRRARDGSHDFACRSITGQCELGKSLNCKRCRFDQILILLERSGALNKKRDLEDDSPVEDPFSRTPRPILERVKTHYNTMSLHRLSSELNARRDPPHPLEISLERGPFYSADFAAITGSVRILMTVALEFGNNAFPEFAELADAEKWELAQNFFYRFRMFEAMHRTIKIFGDDPTKVFVSYATYFTIPFDEKFFETAPTGADIPGVLAHMRHGEQEHKLRELKDRFYRLNMSDEEFLVVAVLIFWTTKN
uniref:Nuclear receptor n=1 Tax=Pristionchus pacificus TaxID=54126 RepID=A0A8R1V7U2_PRIPA